MAGVQSSGPVVNVAPVGGQTIGSHRRLLFHEQTVVFRTLGGYRGAGLTTKRERMVIRSLGEEVDEDEAYASRLFETRHTSEENKVKRRQYLVLISWFLWGTTAGAWEGWNAAYIWNEVKDRIGAHRSVEAYMDYLLNLRFIHPPFGEDRPY